MLVVLSTGCDEPPPPPPLPGASDSAKPKGTDAQPLPDEAKPTRQGMDVKKKLRAELCYYAGFGATYALTAYRKSLGGSEPSKQKIPSFGEYGQRGKNGKLPFDRHLRTCSAAERLARGKWPQLDEALKTFASQATNAARVLSHASGYYARKEHERDDMTAGTETHQQIADSLSQFAELHDAYGQAFLGWLDGVDPTVDEEARNEVCMRGLEVVRRARTVTTHLLADKRDEEATKKAIAALETTIAGLTSTPRLGVLSRHATALVETAKKAPAMLDAKSRYEIADRFIAVLEADNRVVQQSLRGGRAKTRNPRATRDRGAKLPPKPVRDATAPSPVPKPQDR